MKKNYKTMILPIISVIVLGVGTLVGLNQQEQEQLTSVLESVVTVGFTAYGVWGVIKSHLHHPKK